jgi:ATP-dependent Clp protease ATP-binding subunit ClpA
MFERYTDRARRVVVLAQEEASALSHNYVGTEHLLLGLMREGDGTGAQVLNSAGAQGCRWSVSFPGREDGAQQAVVAALP